MNTKVGYWIIGAAFFVQVLIVPWQYGHPLNPSPYAYLPVFTKQQEWLGNSLTIDMKRLVIQLLVTALIAVGYAYTTRAKGEAEE